MSVKNRSTEPSQRRPRERTKAKKTVWVTLPSLREHLVERLPRIGFAQPTDDVLDAAVVSADAMVREGTASYVERLLNPSDVAGDERWGIAVSSDPSLAGDPLVRTSHKLDGSVDRDELQRVLKTDPLSYRDASADAAIRGFAEMYLIREACVIRIDAPTRANMTADYDECVLTIHTPRLSDATLRIVSAACYDDEQESVMSEIADFLTQYSNAETDGPGKSQGPDQETESRVITVPTEQIHRVMLRTGYDVGTITLFSDGDIGEVHIVGHPQFDDEEMLSLTQLFVRLAKSSGGVW